LTILRGTATCLVSIRPKDEVANVLHLLEIVPWSTPQLMHFFIFILLFIFNNLGLKVSNTNIYEGTQDWFIRVKG